MKYLATLSWAVLIAWAIVGVWFCLAIIRYYLGDKGA